MQEVLICAALYLAAGIIDLYPLFKRKQQKVLKIILPIYIVTFAVDVIASTTILPVSITALLERMLSAFVK